jgi:hypothetical protein
VRERAQVAKCSQEQYKTISPLVKSGAVGVVITSMEAFPRNEQIEHTGARVLALLLDAQGVAEAIDKMKDLAERLIKTKDESLLPDLSRATATVGCVLGGPRAKRSRPPVGGGSYLALAPQNKAAMIERRADGTVMSMIKFFESLKGGDATTRAQARKAAFRTLGQMAVAGTLDPALGAVAYVVESLRNPNLSPQEKQAVLECIKSMASIEDLARQLIKAGAIEEILDLIRKFGHNEALITAALGALAALAEHEVGAKVCVRGWRARGLTLRALRRCVQALTQAGGREVIMRWFNDNKDTAGPRGVEAAMIALANLALLEDNVPKLLKEGVVDMVMATMDFHCADPSNPQPRVLNAAVALLGRVATSEAAIRELIKKGAVQRAIQIARFAAPPARSSSSLRRQVLAQLPGGRGRDGGAHLPSRVVRPGGRRAQGAGARRGHRHDHGSHEPQLGQRGRGGHGRARAADAHG